MSFKTLFKENIRLLTFCFQVYNLTLIQIHLLSLSLGPFIFLFTAISGIKRIYLHYGLKFRMRSHSSNIVTIKLCHLSYITVLWSIAQGYRIFT